MDVWKTSFVLGRPVFRCYISFREGIYWVFLNSIASTNWMFPKIVVPPKSSTWIGFSIINHPFWGTPIVGNTQFNSWIQHRYISQTSSQGLYDEEPSWITELSWTKQWPPGTRTTPISSCHSQSRMPWKKWEMVWVPLMGRVFLCAWRSL